MVNTGQKDW